MDSATSGRVILIAAIAVLLLSAESMAAIIVTPEEITKTLYADETVDVSIKNTFNSTTSIEISTTTNKISVSDTSFTLSPNETRTVTIHLTYGTYDGTVKYNWTCGNNSGTILQQVSVTKSEFVSIYPSVIAETITAGEEKTVSVVISNPTSSRVEVVVSYTGKPVRSVSSKTFSVNPDDYRIIDVTLRGVNGTGNITYYVAYGGSIRKITQDVEVRTKTPEYVEKIKELEEKLKKMQEMLELPEKLTVSVDKATAGKPMRITIKGDGKPLEGVLIEFEGDKQFTDSSGSVTFTPSSAGEKTIKVYDRFGNVRFTKTVNVTKSKYSINVGALKVGESLDMNFPESGTVQLYRDGTLVDKASGKSISFKIDEPGIYKVVYSSKSYTGSATFTVTGRIVIKVYDEEGNEIQPGSKIYPGQLITVKLTYNGKKPANGVEVEYGFPATLLGLSKRDAILFATLSGSERISLPYNILTTRIVDSSSTLQIPECENAEDCEGMLTIKAKGNELAEGSQITLYIGEKEQSLIAPPSLEQIILLIAAAGVLAVAVIYKKGVDVSSIKNVRFSKIREKIRRKAEPPV